MTWGTPKGSPKMSYHPRSLSWIVVLLGALAIFLIYASCVLVSSPVGSTVHGYFYGIDSSEKLDMSDASIDPHLSKTLDLADDKSSFDSQSSTGISDSTAEQTDTSSTPQIDTSKPSSAKLPMSDGVSEASDAEVSRSPELVTSFGNSVGAANTSLPDQTISQVDSTSSATNPVELGADSSNLTVVPASVEKPDNASFADSVNSGCDLYHGNWVHDPLGPLYTNNSCPVLTQMQNCQGNGRPDKDYENWRWKPFQCDIPRFDPKKFLELMRGKTLAFIGDSVARNQMESMLCILWQVEVPKNRGNRNMQRYYFRSTSVMIVRIWSSWLVKVTSEPFDYAPTGVDKLHLDAPDEKLMEHIPNFDVVVLSSGHWFAKQSVYIMNNEIVGGQLWWPDKSKHMKVNNIQAYGISVETILTALATHPTYKGLTIVRSYSPDHYEGGAWNTGGSCTGKVKPVALGKLVENGHTNTMHGQQVTGFNRAVERATNKSKLKLMDITEAFQYRHDGHPGPYRSPDPNKITKRGPDGRPPPQDCLHWCMPGPVDTWNELVLEIIKSEYEGGNAS
uniref:Protein YLS7-like isoform X2 n=1 Tax=Cicer arietinum TaxID=3827 RepID=A0A1S2XW33_CICAR|nr:protein YLS7-like isoform X2 [Cicer arietinum]